MALFSAEATGPDKVRISPKIGETGKIICSIYFALTAICCLVYWLCGMDFYDAVNHAFSTLASGGFSTKNASAAAFSPLLQYMMILFMIPAGINFILIYHCLKGQFSHLRKSEEFRVYIFGILIASLISGRLPSVNLTSKTAPIIWVILPILFAIAYFSLLF